ncbi:MAG: substrate-binding domain-containing protein [bacterium]|nr:substrate-binding domain-containing protein [bacterium]MDY4099973.1 substrate-binding domain-containing protein [Lachnospiraceae bacterium]
MKKKVLSALLCVSMAATMLVGCGSKDAAADAPAAEAPAAEDKAEEPAADDAAEAPAAEDAAAGTGDLTTDKTYCLIVKSAGNPYNQKEAEGFKEAIEAQGGTFVLQEPAAADAESQITCINNAISQGVDAIAIAANDADALQPALTEAKNSGIHVLALDSATNAASREVFCNQAGITQVGETLMEAVKDISGGEGKWAILSAASTATNQNAWIDSMKSVMEGSDYAGLELVGVYYGDDEYQKSVDQTDAILAENPDVKVICAPTTVGIMAAAKVVEDKGLAGSVKVTGLGLPSEMADYIGSTDADACPYMFLWNPIDLGRLAGYTAIALVNGVITGAEGDSYTAPDGTTYEVTAASDGGTEIILGPPFGFNPENIEEWKTVY